jgi:hypothetical protein
MWTPECDDISQSYVHCKPKPTVEVEPSFPLLSGLMVDEEPSMPWDPSYTIQSPFRPCRRAQRQFIATLLYTKSEAQLQSIEALVEEMVYTGSQCNVSLPRLNIPSIASSQSTSFSASPADESEPVLDTSQIPEVDSNDDLIDEGFFEGESGDDIAAEAVEDLLLNLRQAESPSAIRKNGGYRRTTCPAASMDGLVLCQPRIRKKIGIRKPRNVR